MELYGSCMDYDRYFTTAWKCHHWPVYPWHANQAGAVDIQHYLPNASVRLGVKERGHGDIRDLLSSIPLKSILKI